LTREIDMQEVVDELHRRGVHAYVEQTGGGVATIYAGPQHEDEDEGMRWAALAGPGWFEGGSDGRSLFTLPRADLADFYVGPDDDGETQDIWQANTETTVQQVADAVCAEVERYKEARK
jgi:hypothetical protein